jgi:hypothetical protein
MKKLHAVFLTSEGKKHTLQPKAFDEDITAEEARNVMENMTNIGIFEVDGVRYYDEISGAKIVETIETPLF